MCPQNTVVTVSRSTAWFHLRAPFLYNNRRGRVGCRTLTCPVFRAFPSQDKPRWRLIPTINHLWRPGCSCLWIVSVLLSVSLQLQNPVRLKKKKDLECCCLMRSHHRKQSLFFFFSCWMDVIVLNETNGPWDKILLFCSFYWFRTGGWELSVFQLGKKFCTHQTKCSKCWLG